MLPTFFRSSGSSWGVNIYPICWLLLTVLCCAGAELALLQHKYQIFTTGTFLQPIVITVPAAQILLVAALTLSYSWLLLSVFAVLYGIGWRSWRCWHTLLMAALLLQGASVWSRWQLFRYFGDNFDPAVLANLGGGNIWQALDMVVTELTAQLVPLSLLLAAAGFLLLALRRWRHLSHALWPAPGLLIAIATCWGAVLLMQQYWLNSTEQQFVLSRSIGWQAAVGLANTLTDVDLDGVGMIGPEADAAPLDAAVYPGALDIPGNQLDEDGLNGDLPPLAAPGPDPLVGMAGAKPRHLFLVVLESVRADALNARYDGKAVMPNLAAVAAQGQVHPAAYSHTGFTTSSLKALFNRTLSQHPEQANLLDLLESYGYQINVLSAQAERFGDVDKAVGMRRPGVFYFDAESEPAGLVEQTKNPGAMRLTEQALLNAVQQRFAALDWRQPQFVYLNIQAAHYPYSHARMPALLNDIRLRREEMQPAAAAQIRASYLNAVANADWLIGQLQQLIRQYQLNPLQFYVSDHGESLFDDGFLGHGHQLNDVQTQLLLVASERLPWPARLGHTDLTAVMLPAALQLAPPALVASQPAESIEPTVLQLIGRLSQPQQIGVVHRGGRLIYDFRLAQYRYPSPVRPGLQSSVRLPTPLRPAGEELIRQWGWLRYHQSQHRQQRLH